MNRDDLSEIERRLAGIEATARSINIAVWFGVGVFMHVFFYRGSELEQFLDGFGWWVLPGSAALGAVLVVVWLLGAAFVEFLRGLGKADRKGKPDLDYLPPSPDLQREKKTRRRERLDRVEPDLDGDNG